MTCTLALRPLLFIAALLVLTGAPDPSRAQGTILQGVASVIDGDTLEIRNQRIRLHGIDAPESGQTCKDGRGTSYRCGQRAALALSDRIERGTVTCRQRDTDRYGRVVAVCSLGALDLNGWLVANGHAMAYRKYSTDYVGAETRARLDRTGLWSGSFTAPWDWRRQAYRPAPDSKRKKPTTPGQKSASKTCTIKGNVSRRSGERIYHVPGQAYYAATRISPGKGERWFCSEAEARSAGWRRSKR